MVENEVDKSTEVTKKEVKYFRLGLKKAIKKYKQLKKIVDMKVDHVEYIKVLLDKAVTKKKIKRLEKVKDREIKVLEENIEKVKMFILNSGTVMDIEVDGVKLGVDKHGAPLGKDKLDSLDISTLMEYGNGVLEEYGEMLNEITDKS